MRLVVRPGGVVIVTAPLSSLESAVERFVSAHGEWIGRAVQRMANLISLPVSGRRMYLKHKEEARKFLEERVRHWNRAYGFAYKRIAIKNTRSLWGSCSRTGNLNFSYALLFLPPELADYVVAHELYHLAEQNHSKRFWAFVAKTQPNFLRLKRELSRYVLPK